MSVMAAVAIGSAVVGGVMSKKASDKASKASKQGAKTAAQAQVESTQLQVDEIKRQFDYQQTILQPQIQQQYNAQRAYSDMLGIGGPTPGVNQETGFQETARPMEEQEASRAEEVAVYQAQIDELQAQMDEPVRGGVSGMVGGMVNRQQLQAQIDEYQAEIEGVGARPYDQERIDASIAARGAQMGGPGSSGVGAYRDPETGAFVDPNLDPTKLADESAYRESVEGNLLAGTSAEDDPYRNYLEQNRFAADTLEQDVMVQRTGDVRLAEGAAGTGVYGDVFQESVGYDFAREEMGRELDRKDSAGGNYGGRAIMEANRRAQGLANQEYYNWAQGRTDDLRRRGAAEAVDIDRGDRAYAGYEQQRIRDVMRDDQGYQDYLRRLEMDAARLDEAGSQEDRLRASDLARSDQGYYNYLDALANQAGFGGGPAAQAVDASQAAGAATAGAYGAQGRQLSNIYADEGASQANIAYAEGAAINNALQSGAENYIASGGFGG